MLEFRLLGPIEILADGHPLPPLPPKQRALLVALLLRAGSVVAKERLIDDLWGEAAPATVVNSLENAISNLRKAIGHDVVVTRAPGYAVSVDPEQVDLLRLEQLRARAREAEAGERAVRLRQAVALFRGPPLHDAELGPFAEREARRLEELELETREELIDAELAVGRHVEIVAELERLIDVHPYRESLRARLMLALYRAGRQADALAAYQHARRTLVDDLGTEPGDELRELHGAVLRQDAALRAPARTDARAAPARAARKTVTVLACRLAGWPELGARLDPEAQRALLNEYAERVRAAVERFGGTVDSVVGEAVTAVFGVPLTHEDDALRALRAAVAARDALDRPCRFGVETGEVLVEPAVGVTGAAVGIAQSLAAAAAAGEILLGESSEWLVREKVTTESIELQPGAARVVALEPDSARALRLDSPLVDRKPELAALSAAFDRAVADRACRLVTVVGDPGVGKSRLVREFAERTRDRAGVVEARCLPYGEQSAFAPLLEALGSGARGDPPAAVAQAVRARFEELARERPLVAVLEDVHWADPSLLDAVENVLDVARRVPILIVCTARPELVERRATWAGSLPRSIALTVDALGHDDSKDLVDNLLGESDLPELVVEHIVRSADGNPLFVEELLAVLIDRTVLKRVGGRWTTSELPTLAVPPTIQALIAARLDRLPDAERLVLELGSVHGSRFDRAAVAEVGRDELIGDVGAHLASLVGKDLLRRESVDAFAFRHELVRDAAYESIPKRVRADLHERFARRLERAEPESRDPAFHREQARRLRAGLEELDAKAAR